MGDLTGDFNHIFSDHPTGGMSYNDLYILFYKFYQLEKTTETSIDHFLHLYENQIPPPYQLRALHFLRSAKLPASYERYQ